MKNAKFNEWVDSMKLRNAYYHGMFAARKSGKPPVQLASPKANSWEENIYWRLGAYEGSVNRAEASPAEETVDMDAFDF